MRGDGFPIPSAIELFRDVVTAGPDAVAVVDGDHRLSYSRVNAAAMRLAGAFVQRGVRPGDLIGVALPRSADFVVAVLASWLAGAAYVPIVAADPIGRVRHIIDDSGTALIVTRDTAIAPADRVVSPDATAPPLAGIRSPDPRDIAYVIYTSGSTGRPKGVVVEHGALAVYLRNARDMYPSLAATVPFHSSPSYDMAVTSLVGPLTAGGTVRLLDLGTPNSGPGSGERAALLKVTPSHLPLLATLPADHAPTDHLVVGGEALTGAALAPFRRANPGVTVVNEYGPTEAAVGCCVHAILPAERVADGPVPIGRPFAGTRLHVLDAALGKVPDGQTGELYIAGSQLARGYLNRPGATAAAFLPDPWGPAGSRMYRTGDLVRRRADGMLEFLGRRDDQVKIRGHRVEPGEIEAVLLAHDAVDGCAVVARRGAAGDTELVGYFVGRGADQEALRAHLERELPAHMVPRWFVAVDEIPLTANGKLDRDALPAPRAGGNGTPACSAAEKVLCGLFAELTGASGVGVDDDFVVLGGTSFAAAHLVARARANGMDIDLVDVMRKRTVRALLASEAL